MILYASGGSFAQDFGGAKFGDTGRFGIWFSGICILDTAVDKGPIDSTFTVKIRQCKARILKRDYRAVRRLPLAEIDNQIQ